MIKLLRFSLLLVLISGIGFYHASSVFADGENNAENNEIDISLSPIDTLFDVNNMKPGDWAPRTITVTNSGSEDFAYYMQMQNNGDAKLFNELLMEVKIGDTELYQGKLAAFKSLPARQLTVGSEESLDITIRFPEHLGNDFQGLEASFALTFTAEGKGATAVNAMVNGMIDSGGSASTGFKLPGTSTNIFNIMLIGSGLLTGGIGLLIVMHYRRMKFAQ